jgi:hypothetical protein
MKVLPDWKKYYNRSLIFYCKEVLSNNISLYNNETDLINELHPICFSKFAYLIKKDIQKNIVEKNGIAVLSPIQNNTMIQVFDGSEEVFQYKMNIKDVLMLPDYFTINVTPHEAFIKYIFSIGNDLKFGKGSNKYEVSITFSDTYKIVVDADSEIDAINQADSLGIHKFNHEWPDNTYNEYDRISLIRNTSWNKNMYKVKKI